MTNQEVISKRLAAFRQGVHKCGNLALADQMERTLEQSLNLHEQLEGGYHAHHTTESDTHGWAVADGSSIVRSGASQLLVPNQHGSAKEDAEREALADNPGQKGVFSVTMVNPFEGGTAHQGDVSTNPNDSIRFESKLIELLKTSVEVNLPVFFRKNIKTAMQK